MPGGGEAILYVRDLERVAGFYEACLGLRRLQAGEGYCGLEADAIRSVIADAGGQFDEHVWTFGGYHRCDAVDPEGNIIQVLQPLGAT